MKRSALQRWIPFRLAALVLTLNAAWPQMAQSANVIWNNATSTSWQTAANWNPSTAVPGSGDVAQFGATGSATTAIGSAGNVNIQALQILAARTGDLTVGNSSTSTNFTMTLNGGTVNGVANTVLSYERTSGSLNINNTAAGGSGTGRSFNITLANATDNIFNVAGGGTVNMNTIIAQSAAGRKLTKDGAGVLVLAAANTFSGAVTVRNTTAAGVSTLRVQNSTGLGTGSTVDLLTGGAAAGQGTTLDLRNNITVAAGKTLTMNSNATGDMRSTLLNGANNNTWNSNIVAAGTGLVQINAASGTVLTIGGTVTSSGGAGTATLFTRGSGTVVYNGLINLGTDRIFNKTDAGTVIVNSTGNSWVRSQAADGQIQIGASNALPNVEFSFGQASGTNGRLELNGFNQTVTRLNSWGGNTAHTGVPSSGTNHILRNSSLSAASTLTFATPASTTDTLTNVQVFGTANGLGILNLVSNGPGRTEFNGGQLGANSWTVNSGTIAFTGNNNRLLPGIVTGLAAATIEKAGSSALMATGIWDNAGTTNVAGGMLAVGNGNAGAVNISDGATLSSGLGGGVLNSSAVTFGTAGATSYAPILSAPAVAAPLNAASLTTAGTTVAVTPQAGFFTTGTYRLLDYSGSIGGNGFGGFALGPAGSYPHITAALDNSTPGQVNLVVSAVDSLIWAGQTNGTWDTNTTSNFALASSPSSGATFYSGDAVAFNDTHDVGAPATPVTNSTISGSPVTNGNLTFNNSAVTYSVANNLTGAGGITKNGTGATTLSGVNSYAGVTSVTNGTLTLSGANLLSGGAVNVTGGTLKIGNSDALRGAGSVTVSGGGTFDANGTAVGSRYAEIVVSGAGVGGNGAIVNNGVGITNNSHFTKYTLAGDTTWGGSGRYDIVNSQIFNGGAFTLTKTGSGELWYNPAAGSVLENVIVNGGIFGSQGNNPLSTTATVTVNAGGIHQQFAANTQQHKVVLNDGGILRQSNNTSGTWTGQITLNGTDANRFIQAVTGGTTVLAGKITGTGGFTINDVGTVQLQNAANDYAGDTSLAAGTLNFNAAGVLPTTTNLVFSGGTLDPVNRTHTVASISGASGSINQGTAGSGKVVTTQSTATVFNGTVNRVNVTMSGTGSLTLGGTADNVAGNAEVNSGTLILAKGNTAPVAQAVHAVATGGLTINGGTAQLAGAYDNLTTPGTGVNLAPLGFNTSTYGDQIYNAVGVALNAGTFDLNGREEAINTLTNPAGAGGTVSNTSSVAAKLYIGHQNGSSTFAGAINDGSGTVAIEKIGTGALTLTGTSNFTGGLTQAAGTVTVPTGAVLGNTPITVAANTFTFDGTHGTGAIAVNGTSTFAGAGTSGGTLTAASGTTVRVGTASGGTATTTLNLGGLALGGGANLDLDFNSGGTTVDKVATTLTNGLTLNGSNNLNVVLSGAGWVTGTYPILTYSGAVQGVGAGALTLTTPTGHSTVNIVDNAAGAVNLVVASTVNKWVGGNGSAWDTNTTLNWNAVDQVFLTGDTVVFDDTATSFSPNIAANQTPSGVTFDNSAANPYALTSTGAFGIAGTGGLIKKNTGTVTISSANTYTGTTDVQAGTLIANYNNGTATTVFAAASTINVASGATFKAIANDANITLANNLTGSGTVVIDPHATAGAAVRDVVISGNNAGFTGTLRLSPTVIGDGSGTFRTNAVLTPTGAGNATIDVDAGGQAWIGASTFTNNFIISGHGYAETAGGTPAAISGLTQYTSATIKGGIGAIRMDSGAIINGNVTLDGSAKIMPYNGTGTIGGSISVTNSGDILSVGGGGAGTTLILTGTNNTGASPLNQIVVNAGGTAGTNVVQVGNLGITGTLGTGQVTLYNDAAGAGLRIQRSDGYTLAQNVIAAHNGTATNLTKAIFVANTQGAGLSLNGYTVDLTDGTGTATNAGTLHVAGHGNTNGVNNAVLNIDLGSIVKTGQFFVGDGSGFSGTVNQSGTSTVQVASHMRVAHWPNNTSSYNISGGTFSTTANPGLVTNPAGATEQIGGIYLGIDGTGIVNHSGGTVTTDWVVLDNRGNTIAGTNQPDGIDRYNLSGGTLELRGQFGIHNRNGSSEFNFTGGTIKNVGAGVNVGISAGSGATGNGTFVIGSGGSGTPTIDTNGATNQVTISRDLTGSGTLAKVGNGTLNLNAASPAWTGNLQVNGGTVATSTINGGLGSFTTAGRTITVNNGGTVSVGINNVFGNGVGNANLPKLVINQGGTFTSTRYNALGDVELNGGTLTQAATDGPGVYEGYQLRGNVTTGGTSASAITTTNGKGTHLGANTVFTVADATASSAADLTINTPLLNQSGDFGSASGGFTKEGPGTLTIAAGVVSSYTGPTVVNDGVLTLELGSSIASSSLLTVNNGSAVTGSGTVGAVAMAAGSTIRPGSSPGVLNTGSISLASTSTVEIEIAGLSPGSQYDRINTTGSINLDGGLLTISLLGGYIPDPYDAFDVWLNDGGEAITGTPGTFSGLPEGTQINIPSTTGGPGGGLDSDYWVISYQGGDGNDVRLTYIPEPSAALLAGAAALLAAGRRRRVA